LVADGREHQVETYAATVSDALTNAGLNLGDHDEVEPAQDAAIEQGTTITVRRIEFTEDVVEVTVPFEEHLEETDDLMAGHTRVEVEGADGLRRETYAVTVVDGQETERDLVAE